MNIILVILVVILGLWLLIKFLNSRKKDDYNRNTSGYNRNANNYNKREKKKESLETSPPIILHKQEVKTDVKPHIKSILSRILKFPLPFDDKAITWCANFLVVEKKTLIKILRNIDTYVYYSKFSLAKRSGGLRTILAPKPILLNIQKTIYKRVLLPVNVHPVCMGFRQNTSVAHNANAHLGNRQVLKVDIADFFGSIKKMRVIKAFEKIGYPNNISQILAELCTHKGKLPQGAATSPGLSNIIANDMDLKLVSISQKYKLVYTRYADDLTFSGENIPFEAVLTEINDVLKSEKFIMQRKKTRFLTENKRKIVTGVSISSGKRMTIPKAKKREIRKKVHYILTKGLAGHQQFIGSTDPAYLKRLIGYLNFWLMVESDNEYVKKSIAALKRI